MLVLLCAGCCSWLKDSSLSDFDVRNLLDFKYYIGRSVAALFSLALPGLPACLPACSDDRVVAVVVVAVDRLASAIQKIITIPAAFQKVCFLLLSTLNAGREREQKNDSKGIALPCSSLLMGCCGVVGGGEHIMGSRECCVCADCNRAVCCVCCVCKIKNPVPRIPHPDWLRKTFVACLLPPALLGPALRCWKL